MKTKEEKRSMDPYLKEALDMRDELVAHRRYLHAHAELGFELPQVVAYVCEKLREYGYDPLCLGTASPVRSAAARRSSCCAAIWTPCRRTRYPVWTPRAETARVIPAATTATRRCSLRRRVRLARSARPDRRGRPALRRSGSEQLRRQVAGCPQKVNTGKYPCLARA